MLFKEQDNLQQEKETPTVLDGRDAIVFHYKEQKIDDCFYLGGVYSNTH